MEIFECKDTDLVDVGLEEISVGDVVKCYHGREWDYRIAHEILIGDNPGEYAVIGVWFKEKHGDSGGCGIQPGYTRLQKVLNPENLLAFYGRVI